MKNSTLSLMGIRVDNWSDLYSLEHQVPNPQGVGLQSMANRLQSAGGLTQQARMIRDKKKSLDRALLFSYQGANIKKQNTDKIFRALINPNKLNQDYDIKTISTNFENDLAAGDIVEWTGTNTFWLVYLQDLTELAYFKADIRKCVYEIKWKDEGGIKSTFAAVKGPIETKLNTAQKHGLIIDSPNYTLNLLIPKTEENLQKFKRYFKFFLSDELDSPICWKVEAVDSISTPGIIEVSATEDYINKDEDDVVNGIVGGLIQPVNNPNSEIIEDLIKGETFIKPKITYEYYYTGSDTGTWSLNNSKLPITLKEIEGGISLKWTAGYSGQFELYYGEHKKTIVVESLF